MTIEKRENPRAAKADGATEQTYPIHVSNLPFSVDNEQLKKAFKDFGRVLHASIALTEDGQSRGFGIVEFSARDSAVSASRVMDRAKFNGREVGVKVVAASNNRDR